MDRAATLVPMHVTAFAASPLSRWADCSPWRITSQADAIVRELLASLPGGYAVAGDVAVHRRATVEPGAVVEGPAILGEGCFVAAGAYLRGGCWLEARCIVGPGAELKSAFVFAGSKLAHFNFVGDSILGRDVNLEAGSIVANYRNELDGADIVIDGPLGRIETGASKFGALIGDGCRIGANAVIAPGALLAPGTRVGRLALVEQRAAAAASPARGTSR